MNCWIFACIFSSCIFEIYSKSHVKLILHPQEISLSISEKKNFSVYLSEPLNETIYINFDYHHHRIIKALPNNLSISAGNVGPIQYEVVPKEASKGVVSVKTINNVDDSASFSRLEISKKDWLIHFSTVIGWLYFVAWSVSFYPQLVLNYKRKSVVGLDFNFLALNVAGFFCYSIYNIGLYSSVVVQNQYAIEHPFSINPIHINDIVFGVHAFFISSVTAIQCFIYERGDQKVFTATKLALVCIFFFLTISSILVASGIINALLLMEFFSYVKLGITIVKYIPQAVYNFLRKSTVGWSIGNILLDFTGGSLSMLQMFLDAYNFNSWSIIFTDFTKFGLGLFSVLFDILFIFQHYILYRHNDVKSYENLTKNDEESAHAD